MSEIKDWGHSPFHYHNDTIGKKKMTKMPEEIWVELEPDEKDPENSEYHSWYYSEVEKGLTKYHHTDTVVPKDRVQALVEALEWLLSEVQEPPEQNILTDKGN